jgi:parvulin-like peptidyl-prolyl isomerase
MVFERSLIFIRCGCVLFFFAFLLVYGEEQTPANGVVYAQQGRLRLTWQKVEKLTRYLLKEFSQRDPHFRADANVERDLRRRVAEDWFELELLKELVERQKLPTPEEKVRERVAALETQAAGRGLTMEAFLAEQGKTPAEYVENISAQLAVQEALTAEVDEEDVKAAFENDKDLIPLRSAAHILFSWKGTEGGWALRTKEEAEKLAADTLKKLRAGADFFDLAAKLSDDPSGGSRGGRLGVFPLLTRKDLPPQPFARVLYELKNIGDVGGPVESSFGIHLIRLLEVKDFGSVKDQIRETIARKNYAQLLSRLKTLAGPIRWADAEKSD